MTNQASWKMSWPWLNFDCSGSELITTCHNDRAWNIIRMDQLKHSLIMYFIIFETTKKTMLSTPGSSENFPPTHTLCLCIVNVPLVLAVICVYNLIESETTDRWIDRTILEISSNPREKPNWSAVPLSNRKSNNVSVCLCAGVHVFEICSYSNVFRDFFFSFGLQGNHQLVEPFINVGSVSSNNRSTFYNHIIGMFTSITTLFKLWKEVLNPSLSEGDNDSLLFFLFLHSVIPQWCLVRVQSNCFNFSPNWTVKPSPLTPFSSANMLGWLRLRVWKCVCACVYMFLCVCRCLCVFLFVWIPLCLWRAVGQMIFFLCAFVRGHSPRVYFCRLSLFVCDTLTLLST